MRELNDKEHTQNNKQLFSKVPSALFVLCNCALFILGNLLRKCQIRLKRFTKFPLILVENLDQKIQHEFNSPGCRIWMIIKLLSSFFCSMGRHKLDWKKRRQIIMQSSFFQYVYIILLYYMAVLSNVSFYVI